MTIMWIPLDKYTICEERKRLESFEIILKIF